MAFTLGGTCFISYLEVTSQSQSFPDLPNVGDSMLPPLLSLHMTTEYLFIRTLAICANAQFNSDRISLETMMHLFVRLVPEWQQGPCLCSKRRQGHKKC